MNLDSHYDYELMFVALLSYFHSSRISIPAIPWPWCPKHARKSIAEVLWAVNCYLEFCVSLYCHCHKLVTKGFSTGDVFVHEEQAGPSIIIMLASHPGITIVSLVVIVSLGPMML